MNDPFPRNNVKIVVIGGGTGSFTLLSSLKEYSHSIAAIVNMADDGGSTGVLRDELGTLPPGDVRQCLVALSDSPKVRDLFNYRFEEGTFEGHAFGNLLLSALEKMTGSFSEAVETASDILRVNGVVIPATLDDVRLKMAWPGEPNSTLCNQRTINATSFTHDPRRAILSLTPQAHANPMALAAIEQADLVVIAPGGLYASLGPLLVIEGFKESLQKTEAVTMYVSNLVTKKSQTEDFTVADHAGEIERFVGGEFLDYVLYNEQRPDAQLAKRYEAAGAYLVEPDTNLAEQHYTAVAGEFLGGIAKSSRSDIFPVTRSLIRHDSTAVARAIMELYTNAIAQKH